MCTNSYVYLQDTRYKLLANPFGVGSSKMNMIDWFDVETE